MPGTRIVIAYSKFLRSALQGDHSLRPATKDIDTKCELLTFDDPYLALGPFLQEHANKEGNYVGMVHNIVSHHEMEMLKDKARGQMKATPYNIANENLEFSYKRTSKVKYIRYLKGYKRYYA